LRALDNAVAAQPAWDDTPADERATILEHAAELLEQNRGELIALCVREAGNMCRYYAAMARKLFGTPEDLPGPTGESNQLFLSGRGVFVCISPWNFPLAIFTGQIAAALAAGNAVIAKPAEPTTLIGCMAVKFLHQAGVPEKILQYAPCRGSMIGKTLLTRD